MKTIKSILFSILFCALCAMPSAFADVGIGAVTAGGISVGTGATAGSVTTLSQQMLLNWQTATGASANSSSLMLFTGAGAQSGAAAAYSALPAGSSLTGNLVFAAAPRGMVEIDRHGHMANLSATTSVVNTADMSEANRVVARGGRIYLVGNQASQTSAGASVKTSTHKR